MMRKRWVLLVAAVLIAVAVAGGSLGRSEATQADPSTQETSAETATVERGNLTSTVSVYGTLGYRARPDGSPYAVINQTQGIYTKLPSVGDEVGCGDVLYRVDDHPVVLLCGSTPAYRSLSEGDSGPDVAELNANLMRLGYVTEAHLPKMNQFSSATASAVARLQSDLGADETMSLDLGHVIFLPEAVRIGSVVGELGGSAEPGKGVLTATSDTVQAQVALDPSLQGVVTTGDRVQVTLPNNISVTGEVERLGNLAQVHESENGDSGSAAIAAYISLEDPETALGFDQAPVQVRITTTGVDDVLNVPVIALVGHTGGGFAVEVVHDDGQHELVAVTLGLFDSAGGRVEVQGDLHEGDLVVVPLS
jgi:multidrug efflux pump subunit AcrA (membrane-fusion protein)